MYQFLAVVATLLYWFASAWYFRKVMRCIPGFGRLVISVPLLAGNMAIPLLYSHEDDPLTVMTVFSMLCLSAFKVLAWCVNRGPLCLPLSYTQTIAMLHFPVMPVEVFTPKTGQAKLPADDGSKLLVRCIWKTVLVGILNQALLHDLLPGLLHTYFLGISMSFFLGGIQDLMAYISLHWLHIQVAPLFDQPWMSKSLAEFWSQRWNVPGSLIFRVMVYDPILEGHLIKADMAPVEPPRVSRSRRQLAAIGSFALSGIGHELMYWYAMRRFSGWWMAFFMIQAPLISVERSARKALIRGGVDVPPLLDMVRVNMLVALTAHLFFFGPATADGLTDRINQTIQASFDSLLLTTSGRPAFA